MNFKINKVDNIADLLKNFSNSNKLQILCYIWNDEKNVTDIIKKIWISQSQVSQILNKMKIENILTSDKRGKEIFYKISNRKIIELIISLKKIFN